MYAFCIAKLFKTFIDWWVYGSLLLEGEIKLGSSANWFIGNAAPCENIELCQYELSWYGF